MDGQTLDAQRMSWLKLVDRYLENTKALEGPLITWTVAHDQTINDAESIARGDLTIDLIGTPNPRYEQPIEVTPQEIETFLELYASEIEAQSGVRPTRIEGFTFGMPVAKPDGTYTISIVFEGQVCQRYQQYLKEKQGGHNS